jgi:beta-aspartyl-peptidase (threonine type)
MMWALVLHGGAGDWRDTRLPAALAGLRAAAEVARASLAGGVTALDVVCQAVVALEDDPVFNAGTGSVLNRDGEVEMDASVMNGPDLSFGAVAAIALVRNPVLVARCVMERSGHALLVGTGALRFAREHGFTEYDPTTAAARNEFLARSKQGVPGTVGAVALDHGGRLAAATSTGGVSFKLPGRVGDSALPGAGTYAGPAGAVSATGKGELMMRMLAGKRIYDLIEAGSTAQHAVELTLREMHESVGSEAGFIALTRDGAIGIGHDTAAMVHAWCSEAEPDIHLRAKTD